MAPQNYRMIQRLSLLAVLVIMVTIFKKKLFVTDGLVKNKLDRSSLVNIFRLV
jgi:hypothetical protein